MPACQLLQADAQAVVFGGDAGRFRILTSISAAHCGDEIVSGKVILSQKQLFPLFRHREYGPPKGASVSRFLRTPANACYCCFSFPVLM
jgi:hypothetical protein